jgi:hypothetical protein
VQVGEYSALPHGSIQPQEIREGAICLMDGGCSVEGYASDISRTFVLGKPTDKMKSVFDIVHKAQATALATARPGVPCENVDAAARKLIVDGGTYTQALVVRNDPRIGESAPVMSALRAQMKLATAAVQGMKDSYTANEEVAAVRAQLATLMKGSLPEVASAATALDTKLATLGGAPPAGRGFGGGGGFGGPARLPGSVLTFRALNGLFNTVLGPLTQNGIDMGPTKGEIDTWESGCKELTATESAWKTMLGADLVAFNALLTKNNLTPLKITPATIQVPASCKFVWSH